MLLSFKEFLLSELQDIMVIRSGKPLIRCNNYHGMNTVSGFLFRSPVRKWVLQVIRGIHDTYEHLLHSFEVRIIKLRILPCFT